MPKLITETLLKDLQNLLNASNEEILKTATPDKCNYTVVLVLDSEGSVNVHENGYASTHDLIMMEKALEQVKLSHRTAVLNAVLQDPEAPESIKSMACRILDRMASQPSQAETGDKIQSLQNILERAFNAKDESSVGQA